MIRSVRSAGGAASWGRTIDMVVARRTPGGWSDFQDGSSLLLLKRNDIGARRSPQTRGAKNSATATPKINAAAATSATLLADEPARNLPSRAPAC
jgi:hypothetical protein